MLRTWRIADAFGWPPSVQDEQSAVQLDWLLAISDARRHAQAEAERRANA